MNGLSTRRHFLKQSLTGFALTGISAKTHARASGANDRIRVGMLGCGGRGHYHIGWLHRVSESEPLDVAAVCDIWNARCERGVAETVKRFENRPNVYQDYRKLLDDPTIDAVLIATPDHQHCTMLTDTVRAGKDAYCEKPAAMTLEELNAACDAVNASDRIVQHGPQGRSAAGSAAAKAFIQSGRLGKILRIEQSRSFYLPYWNFYECPKNEADTDWKAFLFNRPFRPFDADRHGCWMGYREFSSGTIGGWMSHFSDFIHYITDCESPVSATTQGGIYSPTSDPRRTCPDTVTAILQYGEGFTTLYTTHFGNGANDYMLIYGTKGTMRVNDPDGNVSGIGPSVSGDGSEHEDRLKTSLVLNNTTDEDHLTNWVRCVRTRQQPNGPMDAGYKHGIACILADRAFEEKRSMVFDSSKRSIHPA